MAKLQRPVGMDKLSSSDKGASNEKTQFTIIVNILSCKIDFLLKLCNIFVIIFFLKRHVWIPHIKSKVRFVVHEMVPQP